MTIEQIIALTQAGFSKYDILEMVSQNQMQMLPSTQQMQMPTQQMPMQKMPTQQMQPSTQKMQMQPSTQPPYQQFSNGSYSYSGYPQNINQQYQQISEQNDVLSALKNLTRSVQNNNINMMQNQMPKQVTTEDAIASIINPPNYEGLTEGGMK